MRRAFNSEAGHPLCGFRPTTSALGSDAMATALEGYGQLKLSGPDYGLDELRKEISGRWANTRRRPADPAA